MVYTSLSSGRISIHALLAESDPTSLYHVFHPAHFYPRSPCGERPLKLCKFEVIVVISIHALLAESDRPDTRQHDAECLFLSTLSLRRATIYCIGLNNALDISIHALLAESDRSSTRGGFLSAHFYPRSPCGERHKIYTGNIIKHVFLSTLSLRRATPQT